MTRSSPTAHLTDDGDAWWEGKTKDTPGHLMEGYSQDKPKRCNRPVRVRARALAAVSAPGGEIVLGRRMAFARVSSSELSTRGQSQLRVSGYQFSMRSAGVAISLNALMADGPGRWRLISRYGADEPEQTFEVWLT